MIPEETVNRTTNRADRVWLSWRPPVIVGRSFSQTTSDRESDGVIQKRRSFRRPPSYRTRRANGMRPTRRVLDSADAVELHANSVVGAQSEHAGRIPPVECVGVQTVSVVGAVNVAGDLPSHAPCGPQEQDYRTTPSH
jgi:hypothetical protein